MLSDLLIHPPFASAPSVIVMLLGCAEIFCVLGAPYAIKNLREFLASMALICVIAAYLSGYFGSEHADRTFTVSSEVIGEHQRWAKATLYLVFALTPLAFIVHRAVRGVRWFTLAYIVVLTATIFCTLWTSFLGGSLVFAHGAGVFAVTP